MTAMTTLAREAIFHSLRLGGLNSMARQFSRGRLLVVCYHGVSETPRAGHHALLVPRARFAQQIEILARQFDVRPLDDALGALFANELRAPTACITFDDGYQNTADIAYPLLERAGLPSTVFLATGLIGGTRRLWTTDLELMFEQTKVGQVDLSAVGLGIVRLDSAATRRQTALDLNRGLKRLTAGARDRVLATIVPALHCVPCDRESDFAFLSWDGVRDLARTGAVAFGAHTVHHEILGRVEANVRSPEICESVTRVSTELRGWSGAVSKAFAYPNGDRGDFSPECFADLQASGCSWALTTCERLARASDEPFAIPRVVVSGGTTPAEFRARVSGTAMMWRTAD